MTHQKGADSVSAVMVPSVMRDKLKMSYTMRVVPKGDSACLRVMDWEVEVKVFGIGGRIEKFAAGEIERSLDASANFMNKTAPLSRSASDPAHPQKIGRQVAVDQRHRNVGVPEQFCSVRMLPPCMTNCDANVCRSACQPRDSGWHFAAASRLRSP